jgi:Raf kinase inhibitor-like YbhB/YbcL family protein
MFAAGTFVLSLLLSSPTIVAQAGAGAQRPAPPRLVLKSPAFEDGNRFPEKYAGMMGVSPPLQWTNVPDGTASFALIVTDANGAPNKTSYGPVMWVLWNIPGDSRILNEAIPAGLRLPDGTVQGKTFANTNDYRSSNPPPGDLHHLVFDFYALDQKLDVPVDATRSDLLRAMDSHVLGKTAFVGLYSRPVSSPAPQGQNPTFKPVADVKQLMHSIVIPSSNVVFRVEIEAPKDDIAWQFVVDNAVAMAEAGNLLMIPGRAKNNDDWMKKAQALVDVGILARKAAEAKDADTVIKVGYQIYDVCAGCHDEYMPSRRLKR